MSYILINGKRYYKDDRTGKTMLDNVSQAEADQRARRNQGVARSFERTRTSALVGMGSNRTNMIVLANLMNGAECDRFGIMETMRPVQELPITDGCIIRTATNIQLDDESILLYEVVRSTPHAMRKLANKINRYYKLINDVRYRQSNYYGYKSVPQLVICGESYEHCIKIDKYLRSRELISEKDSLLYTEDLFYVQQTLQNLYELDEDGQRTWYSLPARHSVRDMERSA